MIYKKAHRTKTKTLLPFAAFAAKGLWVVDLLANGLLDVLGLWDDTVAGMQCGSTVKDCRLEGLEMQGNVGLPLMAGGCGDITDVVLPVLGV